MSKVLLGYESGHNIYVYAHRAVDAGDYTKRVLAVDTGNNVYYFDTDDTAFGSYAGAGEFDIAIDPSDPDAPGTFQAHLSNLGFFSDSLRIDLENHINDTDNPHSVTLSRLNSPLGDCNRREYKEKKEDCKGLERRFCVKPPVLHVK